MPSNRIIVSLLNPRQGREGGHGDTWRHSLRREPCESVSVCTSPKLWAWGHKQAMQLTRQMGVLVEREGHCACSLTTVGCNARHGSVWKTSQPVPPSHQLLGDKRGVTENPFLSEISHTHIHSQPHPPLFRSLLLHYDFYSQPICCLSLQTALPAWLKK